MEEGEGAEERVKEMKMKTKQRPYLLAVVVTAMVVAMKVCVSQFVSSCVRTLLQFNLSIGTQEPRSENVAVVSYIGTFGNMHFQPSLCMYTPVYIHAAGHEVIQLFRLCTLEFYM